MTTNTMTNAFGTGKERVRNAFARSDLLVPNAFDDPFGTRSLTVCVALGRQS